MILKKQNDKALKEWGVGLIQAIKTICEEKAEQPLFNDVLRHFEDLIQDARTNTRLKSIIKEIEFWALSLDPADSEDVNRMMIVNFGKSVGEDAIYSKVNSIIKRGLIKNLTEYRFLNEVLNVYAHDNSKKDIIDSVSQLVFLYEKNGISKA